MSVLLRLTIGCYGQQYALTVRGGFGGGSYAAANSAYVLANPTPADFVFDRWQITVALRDTFAMATRLPGQARPVTLSLVDRAALAWTPIKVRPNGRNGSTVATNTDLQNIQAILPLFQSSGFVTASSLSALPSTSSTTTRSTTAFASSTGSQRSSSQRRLRSPS